MKKIEIKGQATEAAVKKATTLLNQIGIQPNPKPVSIGHEIISILPNNGKPYAVIQSPQGSAFVWREDGKQKKASSKKGRRTV